MGSIIVHSTNCAMAVLVCLSNCPARGSAQAPPLDEVVRAVAAGEQARSQYRVVIEMPRRVGEIRENVAPFLTTRYATGFSAYRKEQIQPTREPNVFFLETSAWNGIESCVLNGIAVPTDRPKFSIWTQRPGNEFLDNVDALLGLRTGQFLIRPSDLFVHSSSKTTIEERDLDGSRVVSVSVVNGDLLPNLEFVFDFDPARDWLLYGLAMQLYVPDSLADDGSRIVVLESKSIVTEAKIVDGTWAPIEWRARVVNQANQPDRRNVVETVTRFHEIEFPNEIDESLFTIPIDSLPSNTEIADGRLGISYRLDDDVMIVDGQPYQLLQPPGEEVTSAGLKALLAGATPIIDPRAPKSLTRVRSGGVSSWWIGGLFVVLGLAVAGWSWRLTHSPGA